MSGTHEDTMRILWEANEPIHRCPLISETWYDVNLRCYFSGCRECGKIRHSRPLPMIPFETKARLMA